MKTRIHQAFFPENTDKRGQYILASQFKHFKVLARIIEKATLG